MIRAVALALLGLVTLGAASANAAPKTLPGSACQVDAESKLQIGRGDTDLGSFNGAYSVVCPILRDNTSNTNGLAALQLTVVKNDQNVKICTAIAADSNGNILNAVGRTQTGIGVKRFDWGSTFNISSANAAYYSISCTLGPSDEVEGIYWDETGQIAITDTKILPGSYCKPSSGGDILSRTGVQLTGTSTFSDKRYAFHCPLLRDQFSSSSTLRSLDVRMYHGDNVDSACEAIIADNHENYVRHILKTITGVGHKTLSWGTTMNAVSIGGHYDVECNFGAKDALYSVAWGE